MLESLFTCCALSFMNCAPCTVKTLNVNYALKTKLAVHDFMTYFCPETEKCKILFMTKKKFYILTLNFCNIPLLFQYCRWFCCDFYGTETSYNIIKIFLKNLSLAGNCFVPMTFFTHYIWIKPFPSYFSFKCLVLKDYGRIFCSPSIQASVCSVLKDRAGQSD